MDSLVVLTYLTAFLQVFLIQSVVLSKDDKKEKWVKIKIVEAPALNRFPSMPSGSDKVPKRRADPSPLSGPPHLQQLRDHCYSNSYNGYLYKACLFNNITQKEERTGWNRFHGVLGMWHEWIIENDTFVGMHYSTGDQCGNSDREAKVMLRCSVKSELHDFTEPHTCSYHMILDTPLACFTGAMQVYHVLSPEQLQAWEALDQLFYDDELTYKGLTKRRRTILTEAGILQKEKKQLLASPSPPHPHPHSHPTSSPSELAKCQEEKRRLESVLEAVKNQTLRTVKDSPELHNKISAIFLFNMGLNSSTLPLTTTAGITANTTVNTVPSETGGGMDSHEEGVAHRENPSREDRPLQRKKPEATDTAAAGGTGGRGHRSHVREAEEGDGGRRDGGHAEELEALVDENELEQLVADIGDQQLHNNAQDDETMRRSEELQDRDINNAIDDLDLEGIV